MSMKLSVSAALACALTVPLVARAEVTKVTIASKSVVANGQSFGKSGPYEKLTGTIDFALDPSNSRNKRIVDLDHAAKGADGRVHFSADLYVLRPVDAARGNGALLLEIANRGRKGLLGRFNRAAASNDPTAPTDFGDGFLMREGYTLVWVGWQFDVAPPFLRVEAPAVDLRTSPKPDSVRITFIVDRKQNEASPADLPRYLPANPEDPAATLTVRDRFWDRATPIARNRWRFTTAEASPLVMLDGGFDPGRVYELEYRSADARVAGVGLAAIRDAASAFRYRTDLPVRGNSVYVVGFSQSGRFLRQFLHDGFNADERDRKVFDVVWPHIAGAGQGSFNERFAMPGYSSFPATRFPYTDLEQRDSSGRRGGILAGYRPEQQPKVIYTNTSVEYWGQGRAAALTHVALDGKSDVSLPENVRIYLFSGTQHGEAAFPPTASAGQALNNPTPQANVMRALLRSAHAWVTAGTHPPESRYPRLRGETLVPVTALRFPRIPGMTDPKGLEGPGQKIADQFSPLPFLVPQVDADGNELAGIRVPEVAVPLATTTGWNFRAERVGNPSTIYSLLGSYVPFARTKAERESRGDPRPSIEERYRNRDDYLQRIRAATVELAKERYLLEEDVENVMERAGRHWDYATRSTQTN